MKRLFLGNLPYRSNESELQDWFAESGARVSSVSVIRDRISGESRGFGFADVDSDEEAQRAIDSCNGKSFMGRALIVSEARPNPAMATRSRTSGWNGRSVAAGREE